MDRLQCGHFVGKDFVLLASDQSAGRSIIKMKSDENKIRQLSPSLCMAYGGEPGERIWIFSPAHGLLMLMLLQAIPRTLWILSNAILDSIRSGANSCWRSPIPGQQSETSIFGSNRHNIELAPGPASAYIRKILAEAIRSRRPYAVNVLLGGFDKIQDESHL